jgi:hypothetical protein
VSTNSIVPSTFTCTGIPRKATPNTYRGKVSVVPELKFEITKSSIESANASSAAASTAGASSGSVT